MAFNQYKQGDSLVDRSDDSEVKNIACRIHHSVMEHDSCMEDSCPAAHARALFDFVGTTPKTTPAEFVERIARYGRCSPCCFTMAMIYLERLQKKHTGLRMDRSNFQRLLGTLVMLSTKLVDDQFYSNETWAQVVGIPTAEINKLELELLQELDFELFVSDEEYATFTQAFVGIDNAEIDCVTETHSIVTPWLATPCSSTNNATPCVGSPTRSSAPHSPPDTKPARQRTPNAGLHPARAVTAALKMHEQGRPAFEVIRLAALDLHEGNAVEWPSGMHKEEQNSGMQCEGGDLRGGSDRPVGGEDEDEELVPHGAAEEAEEGARSASTPQLKGRQLGNALSQQATPVRVGSCGV